MSVEHPLSHSDRVRLAIVHYSYPPVIGGVETVVAEHARLFADAGHEVTIICRRGESADPRIRVAKIQTAGAEDAEQWLLDDTSEATLRELLSQQRLVMVHNVLTMPFGWEVSEALARAAMELPKARFLAWVHDLAALSLPYRISPSLNHMRMRRARLGFEYVGVSELRCQQFEELGRVPCRLIPNGINPARALGLNDVLAKLESEHHLLARDCVLLQPARLLPRKNVEFTLHVLRALKTAGRDCAALITAAPDPHSRTWVSYAAHLSNLRHTMGLGSSAFFVHEHFEVGTDELSMLYRLADVLFLPSRAEGFALPLLEGALHRLPAFCADIEPLRSFAGATLFSLDASPEEVATRMMERVDSNAEIQRRKQTLRNSSWGAIYRNYLAPLLAETETRRHP